MSSNSSDNATNKTIPAKNTDLTNLIRFLDLMIQIDLHSKISYSKQTKAILNNIIKRDSNE